LATMVDFVTMLTLADMTWDSMTQLGGAPLMVSLGSKVRLGEVGLGWDGMGWVGLDYIR
jgi:hypothetical protein